MKSSVEEIRERFDQEVERFSNLETGQVAAMDSPLCLQLVTEAASVATPGAKDLLDIGCGAGNYTLMMLQRMAAPRALNCTLVDLSKPMLDRAVERVSKETTGAVRAMQGDMRELELGEATFDIVLAAATLHHLRTDAEWRAMFAKIFRSLRSGGSFWVYDMVDHATTAVHAMMRRRYGEYLESLKGGGEAGAKHRENVFGYIEQEDTPRDLWFQLSLLRDVGFASIEVLHKNAWFAAFGGLKK
jgi:tRNA (cmo5U34)-methyltransferase